MMMILMMIINIELFHVNVRSKMLARMLCLEDVFGQVTIFGSMPLSVCTTVLLILTLSMAF